MTLITEETGLAWQNVADLQYWQHLFLERSKLEDSQIWLHAVLDTTAKTLLWAVLP